jgi:hypothetical protein
MVCTIRAINIYVHCSDVYVHVYTCKFESYTHVSTTCNVCVDGVLCTDGYIHFMKCTDIVEFCTYTDISFRMQLLHSAGRLACSLGLAAIWRHAYSSSCTQVQSASALGPSILPNTPARPAARLLVAPFPPGLGAGLLAVLGGSGGSTLPAAATAPPCCWVAGVTAWAVAWAVVSSSSVVLLSTWSSNLRLMTLVFICGRLACSVSGSALVWRCSSILLVLELALDDLGLGATTCVMNPIDVLTIGSQDSLQLLLKYSPEVH